MIVNYSETEEKLNAVTHYLGAFLGFTALGILIMRGIQSENKGYLTGCIIYYISLIILYFTSGTYHILKPGDTKRIFQILDHSAIYIVIAASYIPYLWGAFHGKIRWILLSIQIVLAFIGILFKLRFTGKFRTFSTFSYLLMGSMGFLMYKDVLLHLSPESIKMALLSAGSSLIGSVFYSLKKIKFTHTIWHLFSLASSTFTFLSIYFIV